MKSDRGICFRFAHFEVTEHRTNAYFRGSLATYTDSGIGVGVRDWLHAGAKKLQIKADPFRVLEWQKQFLQELQSSNDPFLASVLQRSLKTMGLHASADLESVASEMIQAFLAHLEYAYLSEVQLEKIALRLGIKLHKKQVLTVPDLLEHLRDFPLALLASGPQDLIQASIDALGLRSFFDCVVILNLIPDGFEPEVFKPILTTLNVLPEQLLLVGWQSGTNWLATPARKH